MAQPVAVQSRFEEKTEEFELLPHHEETLFYVRAGTVHYGTEEHSQSLWRNTVATYVLVVRMCCARVGLIILLYIVLFFFVYPLMSCDTYVQI